MTGAPDIAELSLAAVCDALAQKQATSLGLTESYIARIGAIDPKINSVLALNPRAAD